MQSAAGGPQVQAVKVVQIRFNWLLSNSKVSVAGYVS